MAQRARHRARAAAAVASDTLRTEIRRNGQLLIRNWNASGSQLECKWNASQYSLHGNSSPVCFATGDVDMPHQRAGFTKAESHRTTAAADKRLNCETALNYETAL